MSAELREAVDEFASAAGAPGGDETGRYVFARILAALILGAAAAHQRGVASRPDIDTALKYGTNHPRGPFEWLQRIGPACCRRLLAALDQTVPGGRFAVEAGLLEL
jgi:3-hydroxybutyryl-CoA dehydrogenase